MDTPEQIATRWQSLADTPAGIPRILEDYSNQLGNSAAVQVVHATIRERDGQLRGLALCQALHAELGL